MSFLVVWGEIMGVDMVYLERLRVWSYLPRWLGV